MYAHLRYSVAVWYHTIPYHITPHLGGNDDDKGHHIGAHGLGGSVQRSLLTPGHTLATGGGAHSRTPAPGMATVAYPRVPDGIDWLSLDYYPGGTFALVSLSLV